MCVCNINFSREVLVCAGVVVVSCSVPLGRVGGGGKTDLWGAPRPANFEGMPKPAAPLRHALLSKPSSGTQTNRPLRVVHSNGICKGVCPGPTNFCQANKTYRLLRVTWPNKPFFGYSEDRLSHPRMLSCTYVLWDNLPKFYSGAGTSLQSWVSEWGREGGYECFGHEWCT